MLLDTLPDKPVALISSDTDVEALRLKLDDSDDDCDVDSEPVIVKVSLRDLASWDSEGVTEAVGVTDISFDGVTSVMELDDEIEAETSLESELEIS
jgi:hypothetical protein